MSLPPQGGGGVQALFKAVKRLLATGSQTYETDTAIPTSYPSTPQFNPQITLDATYLLDDIVIILPIVVRNTTSTGTAVYFRVILKIAGTIIHVAEFSYTVPGYATTMLNIIATPSRVVGNINEVLSAEIYIRSGGSGLQIVAGTHTAVLKATGYGG